MLTSTPEPCHLSRRLARVAKSPSLRPLRPRIPRRLPRESRIRSLPCPVSHCKVRRPVPRRSGRPVAAWIQAKTPI